MPAALLALLRSEDSGTREAGTFPPSAVLGGARTTCTWHAPSGIRGTPPSSLRSTSPFNPNWSLLERARYMRRNPTPSEHALWQALRDSKLGIKFRRQHVLAPLIVDFQIAELNLDDETNGTPRVTCELALVMGRLCESARNL